jgi:hypothetical protein
LTFPLTIADEDIDRIEEHFSRHCTLVGEGSSDVLWQDRVFGMVLGAAKASGYGRRKRVSKQ